MLKRKLGLCSSRPSGLIWTAWAIENLFLNASGPHRLRWGFEWASGPSGSPSYWTVVLSSRNILNCSVALSLLFQSSHHHNLVSWLWWHAYTGKYLLQKLHGAGYLLLGHSRSRANGPAGAAAAWPDSHLWAGCPHSLLRGSALDLFLPRGFMVWLFLWACPAFRFVCESQRWCWASEPSCQQTGITHWCVLEKFLCFWSANVFWVWVFYLLHAHVCQKAKGLWWKSKQTIF